jgi:hypothetical protein
MQLFLEKAVEYGVSENGKFIKLPDLELMKRIIAERQGVDLETVHDA